MKNLIVVTLIACTGMLQACEGFFANKGTPGVIILANRDGLKVAGYPVGVFNVNEVLLGNATNATEYLNLWNQDASNAALGVLRLTSNPLEFSFKAKSGRTAPNWVTGMRYFQFDIAHIKLDSMSFPDRSIVDFGDGLIQTFDAASAIDPSLTFYQTFNAGTIIAHVYNTSLNVAGASFTLANRVVVYKKTYVNSSNKVVTIYHNDNDYLFYNDNMDAGEAGGFLMNFRGKLPLNTKGIMVTSTNQPTFNTFAAVNLNEFKNNVEYFCLRSGAINPLYWFAGYNYGVLDFPNLKMLDLGTQEASYVQKAKEVIGTTSIMSRFPKLFSFALRSSQYTNDLSFQIPNFKQFYLRNDDNSLIAADYDRILIELDQNKLDTGGKIGLEGGSIRTTASDSAVVSLMAKGVTLTW
jgi:hypothetical protein